METRDSPLPGPVEFSPQSFEAVRRNPLVGEFHLHDAGCFDPGFGHSSVYR
jgi:hypothetical protein